MVDLVLNSISLIITDLARVRSVSYPESSYNLMYQSERDRPTVIFVGILMSEIDRQR
jgi:hypothetical protein